MCTELDHGLIGWQLDLVIRLQNPWHPSSRLLQPIQVYSVKLSTLVFSGKLYRLSVCFNRGVRFDTPKNRVVTSSVILALRRVLQ